MSDSGVRDYFIDHGIWKTGFDGPAIWPASREEEEAPFVFMRALRYWVSQKWGPVQPGQLKNVPVRLPAGSFSRVASFASFA